MGRILQFSDIHFGVELREAVEAAGELARTTPCDLILITGDITQMGYRREFAAAAEWLKTLPEPVFVVPGNHDTPYWDPLARLFWPWRRYEQMIGHPANDHMFKAPDLIVRGVNTARAAQMRPNWSKGVIDLEQTRRAADALEAAPDGALRILACHHPLIEMIGTPMTGEVSRGREAADIFSKSGVDLILTGHVHVPFALPISIGDKCSYAVGASTLSRRNRGAPAGFNIIEWNPQEVTVTAQGWVGSHFEPQRVWNLERRGSERRARLRETAEASV
ncbi:MAG: metallophosphoesterase [Proteobacteria bacterium]|nr:metallophosphoesterase [Pseudomonadota bacterium]